MSDFILSISESRFWFAPIFGEISSNFVSSKSVVAVAVSMSVWSLNFFFIFPSKGSSLKIFLIEYPSVPHKCEV